MLGDIISGPVPGASGPPHVAANQFGNGVARESHLLCHPYQIDSVEDTLAELDETVRPLPTIYLHDTDESEIRQGPEPRIV